MEEDLGLFDAPFFGMTKAEAAVSPHICFPVKLDLAIDLSTQSLDPQQRLLLECTYEAFENGK